MVNNSINNSPLTGMLIANSGSQGAIKCTTWGYGIWETISSNNNHICAAFKWQSEF